MSRPQILIVEDEPLVAMLLEDLLEQLECAVVGVASHVQAAIRLAASTEFDAALLDVNLAGQKAHAIPAILKSRGKRFAFVTGYGPEGILTPYHAVPIVTKPFNRETIAAALRQLGLRLEPEA